MKRAQAAVEGHCPPIPETYFDRFRLTEANGYSSLDEFRRIVEFSRVHHIDLRLFFDPAHAFYREAIASSGKWELYDDWKRQIVKIVADVEARYPDQPEIPIWDFSGYTEITTEPVPRGAGKTTAMRWHESLSHYSAATGKVILDIA